MIPKTSLSLFIKRGYYCVQFVDSNGRRRQRSLGTKSKVEAIRLVADLQSIVRDKLKPRLFSAFSSEFIASSSALLSKGTIAIYQQSFNAFFRLVGDCLLTKLSPWHWDDYKSKRLTIERCSPVTVNMELRSLKAALSTAVRWQYMDRNPFAGQKQAAVEERPPVFFTHEDFQKLLGVVDGWLKDFFVIAVCTGMRLGEIRQLRWSSIDFTQRLVTIASNSNFKTKTGKMRSVPLNDFVMSVLLNRKNKAGEGDYVFINIRTGIPFSRSGITHAVKKAIISAKLPSNLHTHSTRHTCASWLIQAGTPIYTVQRILGHSDVKTTAVYAHLQPQHLRSELDKLSDILKQQPL